MTKTRVTKDSAGFYSVVTPTGRKWTVCRNPELAGSDKWIAYEGFNGCILDPQPTKAAIIDILNRFC